MWAFLLEECREDKVLGFSQIIVHLEWEDVVDGKWNLGDRARVWPHLDPPPSRVIDDVFRSFLSLRNWEIDLVQP
jgi:hypothetical protein